MHNNAYCGQQCNCTCKLMQRSSKGKNFGVNSRASLL